MSERTKSSIDHRGAPAAVLGVITISRPIRMWAGEVKEARIVSENKYRGDGGHPRWPALARQVWYRMDAGALRDEHTLEYEYPSASEVRWTLVSSTMMRALRRLLPRGGRGRRHQPRPYQLAVDVKLPISA